MAIALLHVPLALEYTMTERWLPEMLLAGQIVSAALLSPALCRNFGTTFVAAATAWPALILAGGLATRPVQQSVSAAAGVTLWLLILALWNAAFQTTAMRATISAVATLLSGGILLLIYLAKEFGTAATPDHFLISPVLAGWSLAAGSPLNFWLIAAYILIAAIPVAVLIVRNSRGRQANPARI